jgi:hypothetical protein
MRENDNGILSSFVKSFHRPKDECCAAIEKNATLGGKSNSRRIQKNFIGKDEGKQLFYKEVSCVKVFSSVFFFLEICT